MSISPPEAPPTITAQLADLMSEERRLSMQLQRLQAAVVRLQLTAPIGDEGIRHFEHLGIFERHISAQCRDVRREIDALRIENASSGDYDYAA